MSQGANAVKGGKKTESHVEQILRDFGGLSRRRAENLRFLLESRDNLFGDHGIYSPQCEVPLVAAYHRGRNRKATVDFACHTFNRDVILLSVKNQDVEGTCDEKLEFEYQNLVAAEHPSALIVVGNGWRQDVLELIWDRAQYFGGNQVFLFRNLSRFTEWAKSGFPVPREGKTFSSIFSAFCDREP